MRQAIPAEYVGPHTNPKRQRGRCRGAPNGLWHPSLYQSYYPLCHSLYRLPLCPHTMASEPMVSVFTVASESSNRVDTAHRTSRADTL
jgi:hypothetical protein